MIIAAIVTFLLLGAFIATGIGFLIFLIIAIIIATIFFFVNILKKLTKMAIIVLLVLVILFYFNNNFSNNAKLICKTDKDCICNGVDIKTEQCYVGNVNYYKFFVNKKAYCPDFCNGIAGNLETKCINNKCAITNKNLKNLTQK